MAPLIYQSDKLVFIAPVIKSPLNERTLAIISSVDHLAYSKFEDDLRDAPASYRYPHLSNVHSLNDTRVHSYILSIPSISHIDEISSKCYITYAAHWLDDIFDRQMNTKHFGNRLTSQLKSQHYSPDTLVDRRFRSIIKKVVDKAKYNDFANQSIYRLMLGSLIFKKDKYAQNAKNVHRYYLIRLLEEDATWILQNKVIELVSDSKYEALIHLTAKTVQELWFACEDIKHPFGYTFLYSILYGPALYYHNKDQEEECREMEPKMGASGPLPDVEFVANAIVNVANIINEYHDDNRRALRAIQTLVLAESFQGVLFGENEPIRRAYEDAAKIIGKNDIIVSQ